MFIIIIQEIRSRFYTIINPKLVLYIKREVEIIGIRCCLTFWILLRTFRGVISCMILDQPKDPLLEYSKDYRYSVHLSRIIENSIFKLFKFTVLVKISNLREIRILKFFGQKISQIEVRSALFSQNVNKLSQFFSLFLKF